jgi:hypothetical protein
VTAHGAWDECGAPFAQRTFGFVNALEDSMKRPVAPSKKLNLARETVKSLSPDTLRLVVGGYTYSHYCPGSGSCDTSGACKQ